MSEIYAQHQNVDSIAQRAIIATRELEIAGMLGGMIDSEGLESVRDELCKALYLDELSFVRVIRARVWNGTDQPEEVTRLEIGGYRRIGQKVLDAVVTHRDNMDGQPNGLSEGLRSLVWRYCQAADDPRKVPTIGRGEQSARARLDYELLVAAGRDWGLPIRDCYRLAGPPVSGVRGFEDAEIGSSMAELLHLTPLDPAPLEPSPVAQRARAA
ncbi:hypothetical protein IPL68_00850 [Candidatus Saccharibacteria bacterium]|nr:MAG: hypothetical protein IPL68_00850 [Candidatus Saccharibacteria bacterium]